MSIPTGFSLYLDLLEKCLIDTIYEDPPVGPGNLTRFDLQTRLEGLDWPSRAYTMIGHKRLRHLRMCAETVLQEEIPGDFIETGVWRGGACILLRGVLKAYGDPPARRVWLADSFQGLPRPDERRYPQDHGDSHFRHQVLAVDQPTVERNFSRFGLLDDRVVFLKGWFRDTLPNAPLNQIAILRLDGDMYESTTIALEHLYDKVPVGGFVIVDDYGVVPGCRSAVEDFRAERRITTPFEVIDNTGICWRKTASEYGIATLFKHAKQRPPQARAVFEVLKDHQDIFGREQLQTAEESLSEMSSDSPTPAKADLIELAELSRSLGQVDSAARQYSRILQSYPNCLAAHEGLARCVLPGSDYRLLLHEFHRIIQPKLYLEIGVDRGETLRLATPGTQAIGVDPSMQTMPMFAAQTSLYEMTSDQFFSTGVLERDYSGRLIDLAFIDGLHSFEQVFRDFYHTEQYCHRDSVILLHDCLPLDAVTSSRERQTTFYTGDCWKMLACLRKYRPELTVKTIPAPPTGLILVTGLNPASTLLRTREKELVEEFLPLSFDDFQRDRELYLDNIPNSKAALHSLFTDILPRGLRPAA